LLSVFTIFWGANFILAELALDDMSAISFSVSRFVMGGLAMLLVFYIQSVRGISVNKSQAGVKNNDTSSAIAECNDYSFNILPKVSKKDWPRLLLVSVIGATLAPWIGIEGLGLTHGSRASLWLALGPALSAGIGWAMKTEKISRIGVFGIFLAAGGTALLAYDGFIRPADSSYLLGDLLLLTALILTIIELHLIKPLANTYG
jgi:drug/metabolite transporter (DMT)-like permease